MTSGRAETYGDFIYSINGSSVSIDGYTGSGDYISVPDYITDKKVERIGDAAFLGSTNLMVVVIPYSVTEIGSAVFEGCTGLLNVRFQGNAPTLTGSGDVFKGATNVTVYHWSGATGWDSTFGGQPTSIWTDEIHRDFLCQQNGPIVSITGYTGPGRDIMVPSYIADIPVGIIGDSAFSGNTNLTNIVILYGLSRIGDFAFEGCSGLLSVWFEGDAPSISENGDLFKGNTNVTVYYQPGTKGWGSTFGGRPTAVWVDPAHPDFTYEQNAYAMTITGYTGVDRSISLPSQIFYKTANNVGDSAFQGYSNLTRVYIPMYYINIGKAAFSGCINLTEVIIPSTVAAIGDSAFQGCTSLTNVAIPNGVTRLGNAAFASCTRLGYILIPQSVSTFGESAFAGCSGLGAITFENGVPTIGDHAFQDCTGLTSVTVPSSITNFGHQVFSGCSSLTNIILSSGVGRIWEGAFSGCASLTSISIPNTVTNIGNGAFSLCTQLASITIPGSVSNLEAQAFAECSSLESVYFAGDAPMLSELGDVFRGATNFTVYYRPGTAGWGPTFAGRPTSIWVDPAAPDFTYQQNGANISIAGYTGSNATVTIPTTVFGNPVTSIEGYAFQGCSNLISVTIPSRVATIGDFAFSGCTNLAEIRISDGVTSIGNSAFSYCSSLTNVTIPLAVSNVGSRAFYSCSSLTNIYILRTRWGAINIEDQVFSECTNLISVCFDGNAPTLSGSGDLFSNTTNVTVYYRSGTSDWGDNLSGRPTALWIDLEANNFKYYQDYPSAVTIAGFIGSGTIVTIPNAIYGKPVTRIANGAFADAVSLRLTSVTIPDSVTNIGMAAFVYCKQLTNITIPNSVTTVGDSLFLNCTGLTNVNISSNLGSIAREMFYGCSGLTNVAIPNSVTNIGVSAFENCHRLESVNIPDHVTVIGEAAFASCSNLVSVNIPSGVTSIGDETFWKCFRFANITIPNGVKSIGNFVFYHCTNLTSVTIPNSVTSIGGQAFDSCKRLIEVCFEGNAPKVFASTAFGGATNVTLYYHLGATGWSPTTCGRPTALWNLQPPFQLWAQSVGLPSKHPDACGEMDDPDHDGLNNLEELRAGTDPSNPNSVLAFEKTPRPNDLVYEDKTPVGSGQFALYFGAAWGKKYLVQSATAVGGPWQTVTNFTATTTQKRIVVNKPTKQGFYRVLKLP
jgi:hypothetical protein